VIWEESLGSDEKASLVTTCNKYGNKDFKVLTGVHQQEKFRLCAKK
jgi:hypothetical protein